MSSTTPKAHEAIASPGLRQPLVLIDVSTPAPQNNEIQLRVQWNASTPLNLNQADGDLLIQVYPHILGDSSASIVTRLDPEAKCFSVGSKVFGFTFSNQNESAHQGFMTALENLFAKVPATWQENVEDILTVPNNFVSTTLSENRYGMLKELGRRCCDDRDDRCNHAADHHQRCERC
jgi:NADPH:quinone reductase-like Zn-dependent oxidoreductase